MIRKFIEWFFASTEKFSVEDDVYSKLLELELRIEALEAESVENSNCFMNSLILLMQLMHA